MYLCEDSVHSVRHLTFPVGVYDACFISSMNVTLQVDQAGVKFPESKGAGVCLRSSRVSVVSEHFFLGGGEISGYMPLEWLHWPWSVKDSSVQCSSETCEHKNTFRTCSARTRERVSLHVHVQAYAFAVYGECVHHT